MLFVKHAEILHAPEMNILAMSLLYRSITAYQWELLLSSCAVFLVSKDFEDLSWEVGVLKRSRVFCWTKWLGMLFFCHLWQSLCILCLKNKNSAAYKCFCLFNIQKINCWELFLAIRSLHPSLQPSIRTGKEWILPGRSWWGNCSMNLRKKKKEVGENRL